jgi:Tannase and feruloyl esterase
MMQRRRYAEPAIVDGLARKPSRAGFVFRVVTLATVTSLALHIDPSAAASICANLAGLSLPRTKVMLARSYQAGEVVSGVTRAPIGLCRVAGTSKPSRDSNIKFEVWIPTNGHWNGKYEQIGNGGFAGTIWVSYIADAVSRGYAAAATDDGTSGPPLGAATFIGHPDVLKDFGHRAIKVTTDNSKAIIKRLTGKNPSYSYFSGCSDGGREALMEAQRYPSDFDGIIVGSPANDLVGLGGSFLWNMQALLAGPQTLGVPDAYVAVDKIKMLSKLAISKCVGKDGGVSTDLFLNDPTICEFDPAVAQCAAGQDSDKCVTPAQVEAVAKLYRGPHNSKGELLFPGYEPGTGSNATDWPEWLVGTSSTSPGSQYALTAEFWCNAVLGKPSCPIVDLASGFGTARRSIALMANSTDPDLAPFRSHGGKLIQYAGWADSAIAPENGLNYYRKVTSVMGDVHDFYRVFMAPGMAHCYGGPGPNSFGNGNNHGPVIDAKHDLLKALEAWVERGTAPDKIIATKYFDDNPAKGVAFQRPLCPYPRISSYNGYGQISDPSSFECVHADIHPDPRNIGVQNAYK